MQYHIGCSGWSYSAWLGPFYPSKLENADWLRYYSQVFDYVEIDSSFYRMPNKFMVKGWADKTPDNFRFTAKFPKKITHEKYINFQDRDKKSLIGSIQYRQAIMIHTKRVIFMILPLLFVPLVYGMSSAPDACAVPPDPEWTKSGTCAGKTTDPRTGNEYQTCCWTETTRGPYPKIGTTETRYCQTCITSGSGAQTTLDCKPKVVQLATPPTTTEDVLPGEGGVLEEPDQPLFGGGVNVPPTGGLEQPPATTTQPTPGGGAGVPTEGGSAEQPPQTVAPQDNQDNQGGGLPNIKNQENVPPGGGVAEQPEDDGQEDSSEGAETAGPLT